MDNSQTPVESKKGPGCLHILLGIIILLLVAILASIWWVKRNAYAREFTPVELNQREKVILDAKLNAVDPDFPPGNRMSVSNPPEIYTEEGSNRKIEFTQDELNAVLAKDIEQAKLLRFRLSDGLVSLQFITPVDQEMPLLGGKTFKFNMGLSLSYTNDKPVVAIRGISIGGIPVPSSWWGNIKNKNLIEEFGTRDGFWDLFSSGVDYLEVTDGKFILHLKE